MIGINFIRSLFGNDSEETDGLSVLADILAEREAALALEAEYGRPTTNTTGEPTAVFPVSLYHNGEAYGATAKEFPVPDDGLDDTEAALTQFVANANGIDVEDATFDDLANIEGMEADARLNEEGDTIVECPSGETEQTVDVKTDVDEEAESVDNDTTEEEE